ncbi:MAG TPA: ribosome silencing factor [Edaphobacter sp.]|uniref:ribosome silencing factor n=1 Tax=Edaphobacter sp. TaxID=1934404 RepID=UPI002C2B7515|nr:ribosome silencing factor [Edaphobacter sp.]HUZ95834.1 ribosome silencing factor [Edaphobacter sp.]
MPSTESNQLLLAAAAACEDKKAEDIRVLALDPAESGLTDYFLICNGTNERQNVAITDEIEIRLKREFGVYPNSVEGRRQAEWILMDYVDFIVHVFSPEKRAFYGLERLRKTATSLSVADLNAELKARITTVRAKKASSKEAETKVAAKPAIKKTAAKTPVKVAAKKVASKKVAAKTTAVKKAPAKKAVTKKVAAKKVATKKVATKKVAAKKAAPKKTGKK